MIFSDGNEEPDSFIYVKPIYNDKDNDLTENQKLLFDFQVDYTLAPEEVSDGEEDLENLQTRTVNQIQEFDKEWLMGGDKDEIQAIVYHILDDILEVPCYYQVVEELTHAVISLKELDKTSELQQVEKVEVEISVVVWSFPGEDDVDHMDVKLSVAPASDEAVKQHLETVVVEKEDYCVICMDKIRVGSDVATSRMPCLHVFHRTCGEAWLRSSGICPLCRAVFPS